MSKKSIKRFENTIHLEWELDDVQLYARVVHMTYAPNKSTSHKIAELFIEDEHKTVTKSVLDNLYERIDGLEPFTQSIDVEEVESHSNGPKTILRVDDI